MKKIKIDVVLIATLRPEILEITLNSFYHNLLKNFDVRLIVNVDPIGDKKYTQKDVINVCKKYFSNVVSHTPRTPSFSKAVLRCWEQISSELFLHLEEDWCLKSKVDLNTVLAPFQNNEVVSVRFNITRNAKFKVVNSLVFTNVFSLNPSFFRSTFIKEKIKKYDTNQDPEKQISKNIKSTLFLNPKFILYGKRNEKALVIDIGKIWREQKSLDKWNSFGKGPSIWHSKKTTFGRQMYLNFKYRFYLLMWKIRFCRNN
jgi:hypothetical protein